MRTGAEILSVSVHSQVALRLSMRQFFDAIGEKITSRRILKGGTVFAGVVYFQ